MSNLQEYFHTDWAAMTLNDWIGLILTVAVFLLLAGMFIYVFHPKNKAKFESQRHIPIDEDRFETEDKK